MRARRSVVGFGVAISGAVAFLTFSPDPAARAQAPAPVASAATVFAVGDIMNCDTPDRADLTGQLMERLLNETPNSIGITLGDNSNDDGSELSYGCLDRSAWGRLMSRVFPTPGNHDYDTDKELPYYYLYFPNAGPVRHGYYAYDVGSWRVYALNSDLALPELRLAQLLWLESDLRGHYNGKCILAYFHRPPFSSGSFASPRALPIYRKLYKYGADLIATGHEHFFSSLPPLNPDGAVDRSHGIPALIAGTGGAVFFDRPERLRYPNDGEVVLTRTLGVVRITLKRNSYDWAFVPVNPTRAELSGSGQCHENPPGYVG